MNAQRAIDDEMRGRIFRDLEETPQVRFESLPEPMRRRYYHDPVVHVWVSAFIHRRIKREAMFEGLASAMVEKSTALESTLTQYLEWFGAPLTTVKIPA